MYSREEVKQLKETFWTRFGQYMALHTSADGEKINWVNYRTGIKHLRFKMEADKRVALIAIEWTHQDISMRTLLWEQFEEYRTMLTGILGEEWIWDLEVMDEQGKLVSMIYTTMEGKSIFKQEDWPDLISFFKPRLMALDEFWCDAQYGFEIFKS
ncbi:MULTISPECIES: DUF4268 domain-containing protein [Sphingobacterium]|uniref:DUF4268 domain-containing protein n=1 Tax=Sphingobacterium TaxID=28453 RepID=UPI0004E5EF74|nr:MULTISPECIES: DUF4268 domain-containing protein [Sphingobacterium]UXD71728.1 DUF4268 domain-containing protein [Sphingobacterium faecium]WGQ15386.1 DUF4268 domain-containing protein [Sphingobacterium faecium]CDS92615.1 conserved hypothetical protein [Sphingobacterium sp. PM2-P1-29]